MASKTEAVIGYNATVLIRSGSQVGTSALWVPKGHGVPEQAEWLCDLRWDLRPLWPQNPCLSLLASGQPHSTTKLQSPPPHQTAPAPWRELASPTLSETNLGSKVVCLEPKPPTWLLSLHSFKSFKPFYFSCCGHLISNLRSQVFTTFQYCQCLSLFFGYASGIIVP